MKLPRELSVGNRVLDSKHNDLYSMIKNMAHLVEAKNMAAVLEAFELLEKCLCDYFVIEEDFARVLDVDFANHKLAHQLLLDRYKHIRIELTAKNGAWTKFEGDGYVESMRNCLFRHIEEDDNHLKVVLETHYYDFRPH